MKRRGISGIVFWDAPGGEKRGSLVCIRKASAGSGRGIRSI
ncbi:hypothetical protein GCWU000341_00912 [Oribacterium sp. oral taxon 078 str. F0262]|nr:hypothetical protein GCWU000341_00912 [Oribacterium sp. oral taxon 078 str. F0262]